MLAFLKKNGYRLRYGWIDKHTVGLISFGDEVVINLELQLATIFIHERCHHFHRNWDEARVLKYEDRQIKRMTVKEIRKLGRKLLKRGGRYGPKNC